MVVSAQRLKSFDTNLPADSVEFCPSPGHWEYFVCGTYQLQQETTTTETTGEQEAERTDNGVKRPTAQTRIGQCMLMRASPSGDFEHLQSVDMPAILDMKWSHSSTPSPLLAIADAVGALRFYNLNNTANESRAALHEFQVLQATESSNICLSLDWSDRLISNSKVVASISNGRLLVADPVNGEYAVTRDWHAHDYEPWIAAWGWSPDIVYSGGDDLCWKGWDLRTDLATPMFQNKRSFEGGVTSIQCHPQREHYIAVGSYDSHVRIFDVRQPFKPMVTTNVGGGAWRVKWNPSSSTRKDDLLVACMHDGFKIIRHSLNGEPSSISSTPDGDGEASIVVKFDDHASLAYGADWYHGEEQEGTTLVASCSFYDHCLMTWRG
ncbi:hypothetical protein FRC20_003866 [Serendipita sp. 405]|nr:hypothetical protein FRC20_003866 [Serendipita sp. 405]